MDKITEEVLSNLIRRIELIEKKINFRDEPPATIGQLNFIKGLGGTPRQNITKQEASELINSLLRKKRKKDSKEGEITHKETYSEGKSLSQEEIQEIGEENLL